MASETGGSCKTYQPTPEEGGLTFPKLELKGALDGKNQIYRLCKKANVSLPIEIHVRGERIRNKQDFHFDSDSEGPFVKLNWALSDEDSLHVSAFVDVDAADSNNKQPQWLSLDVIASLPASIRAQNMIVGRKSPLAVSSHPKDSLDGAVNPRS